jgi:hypothetical protein
MSQHLIKQVLQNVDGNTIVSIDTLTQPTMSGGQANPYKGRVFKVMIGANVIIFTNKRANGYENMVNRRLEKEGLDPNSFKVGPRAWGKRVDGTPFVEHNGETYLEVIFLKPGKPQYFCDMTEVTPAAAETMGVKMDKQEGEQGGLKNKVIIRTFKMDSITAITINGTKHTFK